MSYECFYLVSSMILTVLLFAGKAPAAPLPAASAPKTATKKTLEDEKRKLREQTTQNFGTPIAPEENLDSDYPDTKEEIALEKKYYKPVNVIAAENIIEKNDPAEATVKISGWSSFSSGGFASHNSHKFESARPHFSIGDTKLRLQAVVDDKVNKRCGYTFRMNPNVDNQNFVDRNFVWLEVKNIGYFQFGNDKPVYHTWWKYAQGLLGGHGAWDAEFNGLYENIPGTFNGTDFVPTSNTGTQIQYVTPDIGGFRFGVSYVPVVSHRGGVSFDSSNPGAQKGAKNSTGLDCLGWDNDKFRPVGKDNLNLFARYEREFGDFGFGVAGTYIRDNATINLEKLDPTLRPLGAEYINVRPGEAWGLSGQIGYKNVYLGVEYMDNQVSHLPESNDFYITDVVNDSVESPKGTRLFSFENGHEGNAGKSITTALWYEASENLQLGLGYQNTRRKLNKEDTVTRDSVVATVDYRIMPGLSWVSEVDYIWSHKNGKSVNHGLVVQTGIKVQI